MAFSFFLDKLFFIVAAILSCMLAIDKTPFQSKDNMQWHFYFSIKAFVVSADWNCLTETLPMSTHIGLDTLLSGKRPVA